ncbi:MAG: YbjN domain-containing protein [Alphaproteobacteria bacterium]
MGDYIKNGKVFADIHRLKKWGIEQDSNSNDNFLSIFMKDERMMGYYKKSEKQPVAMLKHMMKSKGFSVNAAPQHHKMTHDSSGKQNPIATIASYFEEQSWHFEQFNRCELLLDVAGEWCRYRFYFSFIPERQFFYVTARIELPIPKKSKDHYSFLLQGLNESMRLGHVDLSPEDHKPVWRFLLPLRGAENLTLGQLADVLEEALYECDKIYPAFQLFVWGGYDADEAISSVLFPVMGSA